ncbi:vWA domain-containing protein [Lacticaseibacillus sharpeae]|uniref:VWFA domain-containing protein n=1 Tax=Lacticaseibacillus sharpeae JCM 1186 = DSM 20505 TaxID=1291052 RepID=A0A0R1ZLA0_9LACO|nr:SpaA isopeptide-forming pilin-related protein [Lacticaseibacillus sharpeae]KRM55758.1 hypothetical protein FC18_GL001026 [Lacticaseibacillus sharpeae JCM 1186 = DSM 20505]
MRKLLTGIAVFALILMQVQGVFGLTSSNTVNAREEQVVLDNDLARVSVTSEVAEDAIEWTLHYKKRALTDDATQRAIRVRLAQAEDGTGTVQRKEGDLKQAEDDDWFREAEYTAESDGTLTVTTPLDAKQLAVWVQLDSQLMGQETPDLLTGTDATAKVVAAPEIPATETPEKEDATEPETEIVADETPVNVAKPQLQEEAAPAKEVEAKQEEQQAAEARLAYAAPLLLNRAGSTNPDDQFKYVTDVDAKGTYPENNTNQHITTADKATSNADVRNYAYNQSGTSTADTTVTSILNQGTLFEKGYSRYTGIEGVDQYNVYTKKSVQPTGNENEYQVQLDVIGDAIETLPDLDVVLVIDKSGSMNDRDSSNSSAPTRWKRLQTAVQNFSTELLSRGNGIQIGMSVFGGTTNSTSSGRPYAEIASFSDADSINTENPQFDGYTSSAQTLMDHEVFTGNDPLGGTPTFIGLDAGLNLLMNKNLGARDNVAKVMIVVSDGDPTFSAAAGTNQYYYDSDGEQRSVQASLNRATASVANNSLRYVLNNTTGQNGQTNYEGNGSVQNNDGSINTINAEARARATIAHAEARYANTIYSKTQKFAIGFYTGERALRVLNALGTAGTYQADNLTELQSALDKILQITSSKIIDGILTDPMGDAVTRISDVTMAALTLNNGTLTVTEANSENYPEYAENVQPTFTEDKIVLEKVTLGAENGAQEGLRITYLVALKDDYRNGNFYPTNKKTELANLNNKYLHFAIPSIRDFPKLGDITVKKVWQDADNAWSTRQAITMVLQNRKKGTNDVWTNVAEQNFSTNDASYTFKDVPINHGSILMEYRVVEEVAGGQRVPGYENPTYAPATTTIGTNTTLTVTNKLKYANYEFTKVSLSGKELAGAKFEVTRANSTKSLTVPSDASGKVTITNLPIGEYTVEEIDTPTGYDGKVKFNISVTDDGANGLKLTSTLKNNIAENPLKDTSLTVIKRDNSTQAPLSGAQFEVWEVSGDTDVLISSGVTNTAGKLVFEEGLPAGSYKLTETEAPAGYMLLEGDFTFTITDDGEVKDFKYSGKDVNNDQKPTLTLTGSDKTHNELQITANNLPKAPPALPRTGGMGTQIILIVGLLALGAAGFWKLTDWRKNRGGDEDA